MVLVVLVELVALPEQLVHKELQEMLVQMA
jgi:hypothetical protein